ncbi:MAG: glycoside hydrolase family 31 protein [Anaerolineae bacterium]|jgi:alpha-glucosidase
MASYTLKQLLEVSRSLSGQTLLGRLTYPLRRRFHEACPVPGSSEPRPFWRAARAMLWRRRVPAIIQPLGDVVSYQRDAQMVALWCSHGLLLLEVLAADLIRFRLLPLDTPADEAGTGLPASPSLFSYALDPEVEWPPVPFEVKEAGRAGAPEAAAAIVIRTEQLVCRVDRSPCRLSFYDVQGRPLSEDACGLGFRGQGATLTRRLAGEEALYGLGENTFGFNLRGQRLEMWNTDPETYEPAEDPINLCIPMLVGLHQGRAYGLFFDNPGRARFDLGRSEADQLRYQADTGELCAYFFGGGTLPAVLERYTQLTGRMPLPPRWMLGYHQSRWSYYPEHRLRELSAEFRQRRIPCDVLHLDIHYMDGYRVFTWDRDRFPDPPQLLADLGEQGFRVITIIDPGVKVDPGYHVHDEGVARDAFCRLPDGTLFQGPVWPGECYFPDFTDPQVRAWWGDLYQPLLEAGVAGFWNDMNEPAIFGGTMPHNLPHHYEGRGATHGEIHNVYGLQMARASAEGLRRLLPGERVPLISRSGYAGLQRYALVWTGDNQSTWAQLRLGVGMCLNLGLSGVAFCGPDTGGFSGDCSGELLVRWTQFCALAPFFRNHSALGTCNQEPWAFGEPYESICRRWIELRYELLPYLYTAAWQTTQTGLPMMRPLALAFPQDPRTYRLDDQFLLGDALLAAPVGHPGHRSRQVYLPGGPWYDFWTGARLSGEVTADAPLERMPLYVRAGSVLPLGPVLQHSGQWPPEVLHLHVYPGDGEGWLYEDDGHSQAYRSGDLQVTRFRCETAPGGGLTVRREVDGPFNPGYDRFEIHVHGQETAPRQVLVDGQAVDGPFEANTGTVRLSARHWTRVEIK